MGFAFSYIGVVVAEGAFNKVNYHVRFTIEVVAYGEFLFCFSVPEVVGGYHLFAAFVVSSA